MIALLPLLLAAAPVSGEDVQAPVRAFTVATATVTIIQPERISPSVVEKASTPDRQIRQRDRKPLVEFF